MIATLIVQSSRFIAASGCDERFDCHFWRIHLVCFRDGRVLQIVVFAISKAVTALDRWIAENLERFHDALP